MTWFPNHKIWESRRRNRYEKIQWILIRYTTSSFFHSDKIFCFENSVKLNLFFSWYWEESQPGIFAKKIQLKWVIGEIFYEKLVTHKPEETQRDNSPKNEKKIIFCAVIFTISQTFFHFYTKDDVFPDKKKTFFFRLKNQVFKKARHLYLLKCVYR